MVELPSQGEVGPLFLVLLLTFFLYILDCFNNLYFWTGASSLGDMREEGDKEGGVALSGRRGTSPFIPPICPIYLLRKFQVSQRERGLISWDIREGDKEDGVALSGRRGRPLL